MRAPLPPGFVAKMYQITNIISKISRGCNPNFRPLRISSRFPGKKRDRTEERERKGVGTRKIKIKGDWQKKLMDGGMEFALLTKF